jgi:hypothetical protein
VSAVQVDAVITGREDGPVVVPSNSLGGRLCCSQTSELVGTGNGHGDVLPRGSELNVRVAVARVGRRRRRRLR